MNGLCTRCGLVHDQPHAEGVDEPRPDACFAALGEEIRRLQERLAAHEEDHVPKVQYDIPD